MLILTVYLKMSNTLGCARMGTTHKRDYIAEYTKLQVIVIRSSSICAPITVTCVNICSQLVAASVIMRELDMDIDPDLLMAAQVSNPSQNAYDRSRPKFCTCSVRDILMSSIFCWIGLLTSKMAVIYDHLGV